MTNKAEFLISKNEYLSEFSGKKESEIWDAFRKGNRSALMYIYQTFMDDLLTYGYQFAKDQDKVKDFIQDLFLYLHRTSQNLQPTDSIKFYLYRSLRRLIAKECAKSPFVFFPPKHPQGHFTIDVSTETTLIQQEEKTWKLVRLKNAINELPLRQKEIIYYFFLRRVYLSGDTIDYGL